MVTPLDRLVRKEVALGAIRELPYPEDHIGLQQIAPWLDVDSDDVIFEYLKGGLSTGLAPARAEDAESELAQKDEMYYGLGRASIVDWALKDKYTASDVTRYREDLMLRELASGQVSAGNGAVPVFAGRTAADFERRVARDDALRRRKLDNRIEWLIWRGLEDGAITYNDGRINFTVNFGRPGDQHNIAPPSTVLWNDVTCDPVGDILAMKKIVKDRTGIAPVRGFMSEEVLNSFWRSERFLAAAGFPVLSGTTSNVPLDPNYVLMGWDRQRALQMLQQATGVTFTIYDAVYRTRPIGSQTFTNNRFFSANKVLLLPNIGTGDSGIGSNTDGLSNLPSFDLGDIDDTQIGFAKTLTAPHPEGNWASGYYEWEDETRDPWMTWRGTGIKAFPVFPYLEFTISAVVLP